MKTDPFYDLVDDIDKYFQDNGEVGFLKLIADRYDLSHCAYLAQHLPDPKDRGQRIFATYTREWVSRYSKKTYVDIDPVIGFALKGLMPLDWSTVRSINADTIRLFGEAREFGVGRHGLSFPVRGLHGEVGVLSINSHASDVEWVSLKRRCMRDFQILAHYFHSQLLLSHHASVPARPLNAREQDCIKWAAMGKSVWETATIMGIPTRTIEYHLEQARVKLGAINKTHAVAKATKIGLV